MTDGMEAFDSKLFEQAAALLAKQLAFFRTDDFDAAPTQNEGLIAGHLIGSLYANGFLRQPPSGAT